ncbi:hypothetical protein DH2020_007872 [Rehmannia glutinosa]|uniref:Uncharacterized protein n=1 Tax=Rehmannia glutinosa TaxID=99300 RepID=A0ABR0TZE2_REHGL
MDQCLNSESNGRQVFYQGEMVRKHMEFVGLEKLVEFDTYHDLIHARAENTESEFDNNLCEFQTLLYEDDHVDDDYKIFLSHILTKESRTKSRKKHREKDDDDVCELDSDCYTEAENDPQYELFLKSLRAHEKSYVIKDERNGLPWVFKYEGDEYSDKEGDVEYKRKLRSATKQNNGISKYEGDECSDKECDTEYKRKLRSATKQNNGNSNRVPSVEDQSKHDSQSTSSKETKNLTRRKLRNRAKSEKVQNVKFSTDAIVQDPDYLTFLKIVKVVEDQYVYAYGADTVVYELNDGERNHEREEHDDDWSADVEILESTFYKEGNLNPSMAAATDVLQNRNKDSVMDLSRPAVQSEFRQQLIDVLRKPYDKGEYARLLHDIKFRKPEERHIELRHGRDRSCKTNKYGKSYLDHHPDLRRQLLRLQDDKPKRLNLLRGFFFWLKKSSQDGSFHPWQDEECLAIKPESRYPGFSSVYGDHGRRHGKSVTDNL